MEAEVDIDCILDEFSRRVGESEPTYFRRLGPVLDSITKILARVPDEVIAAIPSDARNEVQRRLNVESERWK